MKYSKYVLAAVLAFVALPALAANVCYTPEQLQAEHMLRLHSELMVITVTCRQGSGGQDLPTAYGNFTKRNIRVLRDAEQTMTSYYQSHGGGGMDKLDRLRTKLANEFGQKAADMSSAAFCAAYRDKVWQYESKSPADVQNEIERMEISEHAYQKPCSTPAVVRKIN